ncbi:MAG: putative Ig domain-containing protein [Verrucomicrobiota bacterium JB022]|nr:putative Ig domain-containing protein [Verrucomicrobiota bacterium JB022]
MLLSACLCGSLSADVLLEESFPVDGRTLRDLPDTAAWHSSRGTADIAYETGSFVGLPANSHLFAYFTDAGAFTLDAGEALVVEFDVVLTGTVTTAGLYNGFRFGVYDSSAGNRVEADGTGLTNTDFSAYRGYMVSWNVNVGSSAIRMDRRDKSSPKLIHSNDGYTRLDEAATTRQGTFEAGVTYSAKVTIARTDAAEVTVSTDVTGGDLSGYSTMVVDTTDPVFAFDMVAFFLPNNVSGGYQITRCVVSEQVAPPPNQTPTVEVEPADTSVDAGAQSEWSLPPGAFVDADGDSLTLSASLEGGAELPAWLTFDAAEGRFNAAPTANDIGTYVIVVTADDGQGGTVQTTFTLEIAGSVVIPPAPPTNRLTLLVESFPAAGRHLQQLPATAAWYSSLVSAVNVYYEPETLFGAMRNVVSVGYFTENGQVSLEPGEKLTLEFDFEFTSDIAAAGLFDGFRFGLYDSSLGTRVAEDGYGLSPDVSVFGNYRGYMVGTHLNTGTTEEPGPALRVSQRDGESPKLIHGYDAYVTRLDTTTVRGGMFEAGVTYSAQLTIERSGGDEATIAVSITGGSITGYEATAVDVETATTAFDTVAFFLAPNTADGYAVTSLSLYKETYDETNQPPFALRLLSGASVQTNDALTVTLPEDLFADDEGDPITIAASLEGGPLPAWMTFDGNTQTLTGLPLAGDEGSYTVVFTATDGQAGSAEATMQIEVLASLNSPFEPSDQITWKHTLIGWIWDMYPWVYSDTMQDWIYVYEAPDGYWMKPANEVYWFFASEDASPWVYTDASGEWEWRNFFAGPLDDLRQVGAFTKLASNASYGSRRPHGYGLYDAVADKTFVCWNGDGMSIYGRAFDHATGTWGAASKIQTLNYYETYVYHNYPNMAQAPNGDLLITYADHADELYLLRASDPHTLDTAWTHEKISDNGNAYPMILAWGSSVFIFYNVQEDISWPYRSFGFIRSEDNGATWSTHQNAIDSAKMDPGHYDEPYVNDFHLEPGIGGQPDRIHFVWSMHGGPNGHNIGSHNGYFAYFIPATGTWQAVDGTDLGVTIDYAEMQAHCVVVQSGPEPSGILVGGLAATHFDGGVPAVVYSLMGTCYVATYQNGAWEHDYVGVGMARDIQRTATGDVRALVRTGSSYSLQLFTSVAPGGAWLKTFEQPIPFENGANTVWQAGFIDDGQPELEIMIQQINSSEETSNYSGTWPVWAIGGTTAP